MQSIFHPFTRRFHPSTIAILAGLLSLCGISQAQSNDGNNAWQDTTHRKDSYHRGHERWNHEDRGGHFGSYGMGRNGSRFHGRHGMNPEHWIHYSPEQRKQLQTLLADYRKKQQDLYKNDQLTLGQYKSQLLSLNKEKKEKMQALLTTEQKNRIENLKKRAAENEQVRSAANLERLKISLNLSDDQTAALKSKQAEIRSQFHSIRENDNLLPQQKMEQLKALATKRQDAFAAILTPDQLSKFQSMHSHHGGQGRPEPPYFHQE